MPNKINFFVMNELFLNLGAVNSPSELQGMLCGRLAAGGNVEGEQWAQLVLEFMDLEEISLDEEQLSLVNELFHTTLKLLDDVNFGFAPLLPGDDASIDRRAEELGSWTQGFLHGVGVSGLSGEAKLSPDVADALRDLAQISQVSVDSDDDIEENEVYWQELVEYVKVAVLTIYTELSRQRPPHSSQNTSPVVH